MPPVIQFPGDPSLGQAGVFRAGPPPDSAGRWPSPDIIALIRSSTVRLRLPHLGHQNRPVNRRLAYAPGPYNGGNRQSGLQPVTPTQLSLHASPREHRFQDPAGPTRDAPGRETDRPAKSCTRRGSIRARRTRTNLRDNPPPAKRRGARRSCRRWAVLSWVLQGDARLRVTVQTTFSAKYIIHSELIISQM